MIKKLLVIFVACLCGLQSFSQDFSNKGKEFWLAYSYHVGMVNAGGAPSMTIYLTSDVAAAYTVQIWNGAVVSTGNILPNTVVPVVIPNAYFINGNGLFTNKAVHVTSDKPIAVYSFITRSAASAATLCLPVNVLGKQYYGMSFTQISNENNASSYITIVAVEDNTNVEIIPTAATTGGWAANSVNVISLNKGEIYQVLGTTTGNNGVDLSGTSVRSVASGTGGCKKIAVFSGSGKLSLGCAGGSADNLYQQLYPASTWGKKYLTVPSYQRPTNYYRIMRSSSAAIVRLNGTIIPGGSFTNGYYQFSNNIPNLIDADLPISVTQYFTTQGCLGNGTPYDPDMIVLNPVEQNISNVTLVSSPLTAAGTQQHNIHVIIKNAGTAISSFKFDNLPIPATASWVPHPSDPAYSYLYLGNVTQGNHRLYSDSGFNALAYGYAPAETYGYSAGTNVKDLYQQIAVQTQYGIEQTPSVCKGSPFKFKISLPYKPLQLAWNLGGLPGSSLPNNSSITQNPNPSCTTLIPAEASQYVCHDSTTIVNGITIYWYSLPAFYTIPTTGVYPIQIIAQTGGVDGCGSDQEINFDLQVSDPPIADFNIIQPGCAAQAAQFFDATISSKPNYHWFYDFGDGSPVSSLQNPTHTYAPGDYMVRFSSITTPGCLSDTIQKSVHVPGPVTATITGTAAVCQNTASPIVTFTGSGGTPPYTFTYHINSGGNQTISTTGTATSVTLSAPTNVTGAFTYFLTNAQNTGSTVCSSAITGQSAVVTVNTIPTATISGTATVCQNSTGNVVTFTGANGTAPYTFSYTLNTGSGPGPVQTVTTTSGNSVTVSVPTSTFGTNTYTLQSVSDANGCNQSQTGTATVIVEALPTGTISGNATVCQNATAPVITFTAAGGTAPYTFTYSLNATTGLTVVSPASSSTATVTVPMTAAGTFTYTLTNVKSNGASICSSPITGQSAVVQINPVPTATISGTTTVCQNSTAPTITFTGAGGTTPYTFNYTLNSTAQTISTTGTSSSVTLTAPTSAAGTFAYTLTGVTDASSTACTQSQTGTATVTVNQLASATISGTTELCLNSPSPNITFTATGGTAPYTFTYSINSGGNQTVTTTSGNSVTVAVPTTTAGTFIYNLVSVRESSSTTCLQNQTGSATVIVDPKPTASFTTSAPICESKAVTFTPSGTVSTGSIVSWEWDYGDGSGTQIRTSNAPFTVTYATAGPKTATLKTISDKGCESIVFTQTFTVNARPEAGFIVPEVCLLDPFAQFTDTSKVNPGTISAWQWNFGDPSATPGNPNTSTSQNPTHTYSAVGPYQVELIVTSSFGCKDTLQQTLFINSGNPVADFITLNAANLCANVPVQIQNKSTITSGSITKLEIYWDDINQPAVFDLDDFPVFDKIYTHNYPVLTSNQTYTIRVRAYSGGVCFSNKTQTITVHAAPVAQFTAIPDVCLNNGTVQLTQGSETGAVPGTGVYSGPGVNASGLFTPTAVGAGTYTLTYTFTSSFGCIDFKTQTIKVLEAPVAAFTAGPLKCEKSAVTFTQNSTSNVGAISQWIWNFEGVDEPHSNGNPVTHTFNNPGPQTVTLTVITAAGCRSTASVQTITINPRPAPDFTFSASACLPQALVNFTNTTPNLSAYTYTWNYDYPSTAPGDISTGVNGQYTYSSVGPYPVRLVAVSPATGCTFFKDQSVNTIHPAPIASFNFNKQSICTDQSVTVIDNSNPSGGTFTSWTWNFGDNTIVNGQNPPTHVYTTANTFNVKMTVVNSFGCTDDSIRTFRVYPYPEVNAGTDIFVLEGGNTTLQPTVTGNKLSYLWTASTPVTYLNSTIVKNPVTTPLTDVNYTLTVTAEGSCSLSDDVFVKVLKFPEIPNTFTPNNDGVHDFWDIQYLYTYPNNRVQVFTRTGQLVFESKGYTKPWDGNMNGKALPLDTYYYIIEPGNGRKPITGYVTILK